MSRNRSIIDTVDMRILEISKGEYYIDYNNEEGLNLESRAEQSRAEQSRAEQSRDYHGLIH